MPEILAWLQAHQSDYLALLKEMVEIETPSRDEAGITQFAEFLTQTLATEATVKRVAAPGFGPHLIVDFELPGSRKQGRTLALAHSDTVHPRGTLATFPFRIHDGRVYGPGALDIKGGIALVIFAARALRALNLPVRRKLTLLINSDEEIGSDSSRSLTEKLARQSQTVLVVEPGTGLTGKLKTSRKGTGDYTIRVTGIASHAGVDFTAGASAILELARQIERIAGFTNLQRGTTVNPGIIHGGARTNVVAAHAEVHVDIRIARQRDFTALDRQFRTLKPVDPRCRITVEGGLNRPPMERTREIAALFRLAKELAKPLGVQLEESSTGGGSDGNFTAALGIPTLDGLGCVGEGAHTLNENFLLHRVPDRAALLASLIQQIPLNAKP
jgi:glutamate carboxypeptidase